MISKQKILLIVSILLVVFIIFSILILRGASNGNTASKNPPLLKQSPEQNSPLQITNFSLKTEYIGWTEPIEITFNKPISFNDVVIETSPETNLTLSNDLSRYVVIVNPTDTWIFKSNYTLTIKKNTHSGTNSYLDKDYVYNFKTYEFSGL